MKRKDKHCRRAPGDGRQLLNFLEAAHPGFDAIKVNNQDLHDEQADHQDDHSLDAVHTIRVVAPTTSREKSCGPKRAEKVRPESGGSATAGRDREFNITAAVLFVGITSFKWNERYYSEHYLLGALIS